MSPAWWWLAALLVAPAAPATPQPSRHPPPGDCRDDDLVDRCKPEQQRRVRELFGVKSIEAHRDAGDQVRRAFYVDGYGNDVVAIAFVRPKDGDPILSVHFPRERGENRPGPLLAPVPRDVWEGVIDRSRHFDRQLQGAPSAPAPGPAPPDEEEVIRLCLHSWVYTVEATDPPQGQHQPATLRRKTEDACDDGLAEAYATELQRAAVPLLPQCAMLDRTQHRNEATLLSACRLLRGDRMAAAEVMNLLERFRDIEGAKDAVRLNGLFAYEARIDWAGEQFTSDWGAAETWATKMAEGGRTVLYWDYLEGESADRVRFVGELSRSLDGEKGYRTARVEQMWRREGSSFQIESATVAPFKPAS